jgi:hypothetical protein
MNRKVIDISRRQLLVGLGGATLALPVLSSLMTKTAFGQDPTYVRKPRLFWLTTDHGGAFETSMFPDSSMLTERAQLFSDHAIAAGALASKLNGSKRSVSPILSADSSRLTEQLISKMNVIHGLDVPFYIAHSTGLHLGNYARNDGNGSEGVEVQKTPRPTIDQIMAWSPSFYDNLSSIKERVMFLGDQPISWNYSDPDSKSGEIQSFRGFTNSRQLFNRIFVESQPQTEPTAPRRAPIVDRVLESYKALRNGNRRLSSLDRQRLDDHIARIAELERKLMTTAPVGGSCSSVSQPTDDSSSHLDWGNPDDARILGSLVNDVMVAGFMCGTSRIGLHSYGPTNPLVGFTGDWHEDIAHQWQKPEAQTQLVNSYQKVFEHMLVDLAAKLDVEEAPGMTYLDNSLLVWTQESGQVTHESASIPVVTFGSAAGFFKTGQLVDYRRVDNASSAFEAAGVSTMYLGVLYNQWLATVLQSMGVPPSEFERWGHKGYGLSHMTSDKSQPYGKHYVDTSSRYFETASDVLPFLRA